MDLRTLWCPKTPGMPQEERFLFSFSYFTSMNILKNIKHLESDICKDKYHSTCLQTVSEGPDHRQQLLSIKYSYSTLAKAQQTSFFTLSNQ